MNLQIKNTFSFFSLGLYRNSSKREPKKFYECLVGDKIDQYLKENLYIMCRHLVLKSLWALSSTEP